MYRKYTFPSKILNYLQVFAPISVSIKLNLVSGFFNSNLLQHHPTIYCWRRPIFNPDLTIISEQSPEKSEQVNVTEMEAGKCTEFYLLYPKPGRKRKKKKRQGNSSVTISLHYHATGTIRTPLENLRKTRLYTCHRGAAYRAHEGSSSQGHQILTQGTSLLTTAGA